MKKVSALMLCGLLGVATLPAQATDLGNLLGEANREASNLLEGVNSEAAENPITSLLSKGLDINDKQAAGGAGAMLAMAYQTLGESQSSELLKMVPGMESLTGMIRRVLAAIWPIWNPWIKCSTCSAWTQAWCKNLRR